MYTYRKNIVRTVKSQQPQVSNEPDEPELDSSDDYAPFSVLTQKNTPVEPELGDGQRRVHKRLKIKLQKGVRFV